MRSSCWPCQLLDAGSEASRSAGSSSDVAADALARRRADCVAGRSLVPCEGRWCRLLRCVPGHSRLRSWSLSAGVSWSVSGAAGGGVNGRCGFILGGERSRAFASVPERSSGPQTAPVTVLRSAILGGRAPLLRWAAALVQACSGQATSRKPKRTLKNAPAPLTRHTTLAHPNRHAIPLAPTDQPNAPATGPETAPHRRPDRPPTVIRPIRAFPAPIRGVHMCAAETGVGLPSSSPAFASPSDRQPVQAAVPALDVPDSLQVATKSLARS